MRDLDANPLKQSTLCTWCGQFFWAGFTRHIADCTKSELVNWLAKEEAIAKHEGDEEDGT